MRALFVTLLLVPAVMQAQDAPKKGPVRVVKETGGDLPNPLPLKFSGPPTVSEIRPLDLMTRLYKFADDSMMGREAGTPWNEKGTDYIAREVRRLGLKPLGDNGTYFQQPLVRRTFGSDGYVSVGDKRYSLWSDFAPRDQGSTSTALTNVLAVYGGTFGDTSNYLPADQAVGKLVVFRVGNDSTGKPNYNHINRGQLTARYPGAAGIAVVQIDYAPPGYVRQVYGEPLLAVKGSSAGAPQRPAYFYVTRAVAEDMLGTSLDGIRTGATGKSVSAQYRVDEVAAPGRNVVAMLQGSDPKLRNQYVVIGAHDDHIGFNNRPADHDSIKALMMVAAKQGADSPRPNPTPEEWVRINAIKDSLHKLHPARLDSIYNGADDDGSGTVSLLEIAEKFATAKTRPKRSVIFAWHTGEEYGMFGSTFLTDHPAVPRDSIVAQLNIDMVGRGRSTDITGETKEHALISGGPGYLQLIGSRRLSTELGNIVEETNDRQKLGLRFDYALDANGHPQNIYCRSDHYSYARYGIPIVFFTTGGHADYHQVTDEPQYIDYWHMTDVAKLIHATATRVGNLDHRPTVDKVKPDPKGACRQ